MLCIQQALLINVFFEISSLFFLYEPVSLLQAISGSFSLEINNENNEANGYLCCHDWQRLLEQESAQKRWLGYENVIECWNQSPFLTFKKYYSHFNHDGLL